MTHARPALATSISATISYSLTDAAIFSVSVPLTPEGMEAVNEVIE